MSVISPINPLIPVLVIIIREIFVSGEMSREFGDFKISLSVSVLHFPKFSWFIWTNLLTKNWHYITSTYKEGELLRSQFQDPELIWRIPYQKDVNGLSVLLDLKPVLRDFSCESSSDILRFLWINFMLSPGFSVKST